MVRWKVNSTSKVVWILSFMVVIIADRKLLCDSTSDLTSDNALPSHLQTSSNCDHGCHYRLNHFAAFADAGKENVSPDDSTHLWQTFSAKRGYFGLLNQKTVLSSGNEMSSERFSTCLIHHEISDPTVDYLVEKGNPML